LHIAVDGFRPTTIEFDAELGDMDYGSIVLQPVHFPLSQGESRASPPRTVRISARITDVNGVPLANRVFGATHLQRGRYEVATFEADQSGRFVFPAQAFDEYLLFVFSRKVELGDIVAAAQDLDLGNVSLQASREHTPGGRLLGPAAVATPASSGIDAIFAGAEEASIIHGDGTLVSVPKEKEQVDYTALRISGDRRAAGWLVESDFCCTSYPISLMLAVYRPGKPLARFTGDGRAIFEWRFAAGDRQVGFYQDYLHGNPGEHYQLRDIESGRLMGEWHGGITAKTPQWVRDLQH
jgi:hypothetical protein